MNQQELLRITMLDGMVMDANYISLLEFPENYDRQSIDYAAVRYFDDDAEADEKWGLIDFDWYGVSICVWRHTELGKRAYVTLSREGHVAIEVAGSEQIIEEHIPDAGLHEEWSRDFGYVDRVREIAGRLYVCGTNRQVYRRSDAGQWEHFDSGILVPEAKDLAELHSRRLKGLMDIAGLSEQSIYAVGYDGEVFYHDGAHWSQVESSVAEDLFRIKLVSEDEVYIVGANGTMLKGNHRDGFKNLSSVQDNQRFTGIEIFTGTLFLASNLGMFTYDPVAQKILPYETDLTPDLVDCHVLEARDGIMWSIGFKDLARFDGARWERIHHPNNPPIGGTTGTP